MEFIDVRLIVNRRLALGIEAASFASGGGDGKRNLGTGNGHWARRSDRRFDKLNDHERGERAKI